MTFEDWWNKHKPRAATIRDYKLAIATWNAATTAERGRCREIALNTGETCISLAWESCPEAIAREIGE